MADLLLIQSTVVAPVMKQTAVAAVSRPPTKNGPASLLLMETGINSFRTPTKPTTTLSEAKSHTKKRPVPSWSFLAYRRSYKSAKQPGRPTTTERIIHGAVMRGTVPGESESTKQNQTPMPNVRTAKPKAYRFFIDLLPSRSFGF